jgi:tetratricopeptide (TPR) repeat protein
VYRTVARIGAGTRLNTTNNRIMNEQDQLLLHQYFNGLLTPEAAQQVRARAASDAAFGAAFTLQAAMEDFPRRATQRQAFMDTLAAVEPDFFQQTTAALPAGEPLRVTRVNWARRGAIAASVVLVIAAIWFFSRPVAPDYQQFAQHAPLSLTVRGSADATIVKAEKAFADKDYTQALEAINGVLAQDAFNITAQLYKGICLLELNRGLEARAVWQPIVSGNSGLKSEAQWYMALSYLKEGNTVECRAVLETITRGADRYPDARDLLDKLP